MTWYPIQLSGRMQQNAPESALRAGVVTVENLYVNDAGGLSRFPGLSPFSTLPGTGPSPVYLTAYGGDLLAVEGGGQAFRVNRLTGEATKIPGTTISGGRRASFAPTDRELLIAAGGPIVRYQGADIDLLSAQAPESTHVAYVDGYAVAIEPKSGRFYHSRPGQYDQWDPLDVFSAEGKPDDLIAAFVTEYNELMLLGTETVEQFQSVPSGAQPFARRWANADGLLGPDLICEADQAVWMMTNELEFSRLSGQTSVPVSAAVQLPLDRVDDWSRAWCAHLPIAGQRFLVIHAPNASNGYDGKGLTFVYDYRQQRWCYLYGWDADRGVPAGMPIWSILRIGNEYFAGGEGVIYRINPDEPAVAGGVQRCLIRTGHITFAGGAFRAEQLRLTLQRGDGPYDPAAQVPVVSMRMRKNNTVWSPPMRFSLGRPGQSQMILRKGNLGNCQTLQLEIEMTDMGPFEVSNLELDIQGLKR